MHTPQPKIDPEAIMLITKKIAALEGIEAISMRRLASDLETSPSNLYNYYEHKESLLEETFESTQKSIRQSLQDLPPVSDIDELLEQRIRFSLDHALEIVYLLRFFLHFKHHFPEHDQGFVPSRAYRHITEVIEKGIKQNEYHSESPDQDAKVIVHAVNGFILEYFPHLDDPNHKTTVAQAITSFVTRALRNNSQSRKEVRKNV